jgi:hypothetical protein
MKTLKLFQEPKREKNKAMISEDLNITKDNDLIDLFPLPRYFQVHFEHIHENTHVLNNDVVQLKQAIAKVDEKIERLLALLSR